MVNRVWQHHFGEGFVTTPDDFGTQSAPPSHPELLDYLAARFMNEGWSIKKLHKLMMLSATYQQSSQENPAAAEKDPFNRWLARANVRQLEFEPLRDSILFLGGQLDLEVGGHPVDLSQGTHQSQRRRGGMVNRVPEFRLAAASRRTVYGFVDRADLLEEFNTFDVANGAAPTGKRYESTVPQQALFLMNSPLVLEQVRHVVQRPQFRELPSAATRVRFLYELIFQRLPTEEEVRAGEAFVRERMQAARLGISASPPTVQTAAAVVGQGAPSGPGGQKAGQGAQGRSQKPVVPLGPWQEYAHALLLTNEAAFVD
jgi:hypothetical protein